MKNKLTKSVPFNIMFFLVFQSLYAQNYLITFSGSGQSTAVETVEVKNIDQQTTLTLSGTDTLLLTDVVGTGYLPALSQGMIIYPNPANLSSRLEFYNSSAGNTRIEIYDFSGRLLIHKSIQLDAGSHSFSISSLKAGIYLVKVNTQDHTYSQRLISTSVQGLTPELQYEGIAHIRPQEPDLKSISNIVAMQYNVGERLVFKAVSGDYAHTKSLVPTKNHNIDFEFMDCIDGDGNYYGVVTISDQCWMMENLKTTQYSNGTPIEYPGNNNSVWENNTIGAYAWYDNDISWKNSYGALYNWHAVNNSNGLCPTGWHVPSDAEWTQLVDYLVAQGYPNEWETSNGAGNALKSCRQVDSPMGGDCKTSNHPRWDFHPTHHGFDAFGFSGHPGGGRGDWGPFGYIGNSGIWWSSTESSTSCAFSRGLDCNGGSVYSGDFVKGVGFSVRCLKNSNAPSAAFTAESASGTAPLTVNFTDQSTNSPTSWQWNFGDGGSSTQQNPVHTYQNTGSYTVQLIANNSSGSGTEIKTDYISVTPTGGTGEPCPGMPTVTDIDGNVYNTVFIGVQCWMKENLKTTKYHNSATIEYPGDDNIAWESNTTGAYAWNENDINWKDSYGALYNRHAVNNTNGLCPTGWHVPSDAEWNVLILHIDPNADPNALGTQSVVAGGKMKSMRTAPDSHPRWENPNTGATNEGSWSGLPGGTRLLGGSFLNFGTIGFWWSATEYLIPTALGRGLVYDDGNVYRKYGTNGLGLSVRCIKD